VVVQLIFAYLRFFLYFFYDSVFDHRSDVLHYFSYVENVNASRDSYHLWSVQQVAPAVVSEDPWKWNQRNELGPEAFAIKVHEDLVKFSHWLSFAIWGVLHYKVQAETQKHQRFKDVRGIADWSCDAEGNLPRIVVTGDKAGDDD
jgi:hypothetical protein